MKKVSFLLVFLLSIVFFGSCSDQDVVNTYDESSSKDVVFTAIDFKTVEDATRTSISDQLVFSWTDGDQIVVFPSKVNANETVGDVAGDPVRFTIEDGVSDSKTASFDGGSWSLKDDLYYSAIYPWDKNVNYYTQKRNAIPVQYTGQVQKGNKSTSHLGAYDFMAASSVKSSNGSVLFSFNHLNSLLKFVIKVRENMSFSQLTLTSDVSAFSEKSFLNAKEGTLSSPSLKNSITLQLDNVNVSSTEPLVAWMMIAPTALLDGQPMTLIATAKSGEQYKMQLTGNNFQRGYAYLFDDIDLPMSDSEIGEDYLTFTSDGEQSLTITKTVPTLEYSVDGGAWTALEGESPVEFGNGRSLRLRGMSATGTAMGSYTRTYDESARIYFSNGNSVDCSGDIRTLVDYGHYTTVDCSQARFGYLFYDCYQLTSAPKLPIMDLASSCYEFMFSGCSRLVVAPELPATTLSDYCYFYMFADCSSLNSVSMYATSIAPEGCITNWLTGVSDSGELRINSAANFSEYDIENLKPSSWGDPIHHVVIGAGGENSSTEETVESGSQSDENP